MYIKKALLLLFFVLVVVANSSYGAIVASDPLKLGIGARSMGMGRAFLGVSKDVRTIFSNPSGLDDLLSWQFSSMSGKFLNDVNYYNLCYAIPTPRGIFGIGYVDSNVAAVAQLGQMTSVEGEFRVITSTLESNFVYDNNVLLLSYANQIREDLSWGVNLKLFSASLLGGNTYSLRGSGRNIDLGLLYKPQKNWYTWGFTVQNLLPPGLGGSMDYGSNQLEELPTLYKLGTKLRLVGKENALRKHGTDLSLLIDADYSNLRPTVLYHLGLEWFVAKLLTLRAGLDQEMLGAASVSNNMTMGIGGNFRGIQFDYAYHVYADLPEYPTSYLSFSFIKEKELPSNPFTMLEPKENLVTYQEPIVIRGKIKDGRIKSISFDGEAVEISKKKEFKTGVKLKTGSNVFTLVGHDKKGKVVAEQKIKIVRLASASDIQDVSNRRHIEELMTLGIIRGYPDGTFRPHQALKYSDFVSLISKIFGVVEAKQKGSLTRLDAIVILYRALQLEEPKVLELPYTDIPGRHRAIKEITALKQAGMLNWIKTPELFPEKEVSRAELVEILYNTNVIKERVSGLLGSRKGK